MEKVKTSQSKCSMYVQISVIKWHLWCSMQKNKHQYSKNIFSKPHFGHCFLFLHRASQILFRHETLQVCRKMYMFVVLVFQNLLKCTIFIIFVTGQEHMSSGAVSNFRIILSYCNGIQVHPCHSYLKEHGNIFCAVNCLAIIGISFSC